MDVDVASSSIYDGDCCEERHNSDRDPQCSGGSEGNSSGKLKRSSSAPMINQLLPHGLVSATPSSSSSRDISEMSGIQQRVRRLSANFGPVSPLSPGSGNSRTPGRMRVFQLKEEEGMDIVNREAAHERTVHSSLQVAHALSQSWEDLALSEERKPLSNQQQSGFKKDCCEQLNLTISPNMTCHSSCGASPTRVGRQCFSPSLQQPVRNYTFCPSPSPTKKTFTTRRSLSPIPLRPSPLGGIKRKWDIEDSFITPNKRVAMAFTPDRCSGGLLIPQTHSVGSPESSSSPLGGTSIGSVSTPESVCSSGSPNAPTPSFSPAPPDPHLHLFKPLSPAISSAHSPNFGHLGNQPESYGGKSSSLSEGSDTSCDAMITEETPISSSQDLTKSYQDMDLSESLPHGTLNI